MITTFQKSFLGASFALIGLVAPSGNLSAAITGPYTADANTLHLWHMDGAATPVPDSGSVSVPLNALANGATLGNPSFSGFGNAVNTFDGGTAATGTGTDAYIAPLTLVSGAGDNVNWSFSSAAGAFSYEAIVRFGYDPMLNLGPTAIGGTGRNAPLQIFNGDQDGVGGGVRSFQFRVDPVGFNPNSGTQVVPLTQPTLEFININNAVAPLQFVFAPIPIAGPDAAVQGNWYHVAVTYNGAENTADNLRIYWTAMDAARTSANMLISTTLTNDLPQGAIDFAIGNSGRTQNNNFLGDIDEVRISDVARGADQMMFAVPEPSTFVLGAAGIGIALLWRRRRS